MVKNNVISNETIRTLDKESQKARTTISNDLPVSLKNENITMSYNGTETGRMV
jgi:hypothetical protein